MICLKVVQIIYGCGIDRDSIEFLKRNFSSDITILFRIHYKKGCQITGWDMRKKNERFVWQMTVGILYMIFVAFMASL